MAFLEMLYEISAIIALYVEALPIFWQLFLLGASMAVIIALAFKTLRLYKELFAEIKELFADK